MRTLGGAFDVRTHESAGARPVRGLHSRKYRLMLAVVGLDEVRMVDDHEVCKPGQAHILFRNDRFGSPEGEV